MLSSPRIWLICSHCNHTITIGCGDFEDFSEFDGLINHHCPVVGDIVICYHLGIAFHIGKEELIKKITSLGGIDDILESQSVCTPELYG